MTNAKKTFRMAAKIALGTAAAMLATASAYAQSTILVVDTAKVYNDSTVGQHVARQVEAMATSTGSQLNAQATPLEATEKNLKLKTDGKTQQQILADPTLRSEIETFQKSAIKLRQDTAIAQRELQMTEAKARQVVTAKMKTIIDQIARERNADVVLEKQLVIYGEPADITNTVLSRLNAEMTTVPVTRERLPRG
ncbi:MAG: OmpH family outer membrane protein [Litorimonas sp.]